MRPKTITGWLAKGGPARQPFPAAYRFLHRLYWPEITVKAWARRYQGKRIRPADRYVVDASKYPRPIDREDTRKQLERQWETGLVWSGRLRGLPSLGKDHGGDHRWPHWSDRVEWVEERWVNGIQLGGFWRDHRWVDDRWVDIVGASVITGVRPKTITGWLAKGGPARQPFPAAHRFLHRLYWPMSTVRDWTTGTLPDDGRRH